MPCTPFRGLRGDRSADARGPAHGSLPVPGFPAGKSESPGRYSRRDCGRPRDPRALRKRSKAGGYVGRACRRSRRSGRRSRARVDEAARGMRHGHARGTWPHGIADAAPPKGKSWWSSVHLRAVPEASEDQLDAALDEALLRLSPSRAAAEVGGEAGDAAKARLSRALDRRGEPAGSREAGPWRGDPRLLGFMASGLAHPCAAGTRAGRRGRCRCASRQHARFRRGKPARRTRGHFRARPSTVSDASQLRRSGSRLATCAKATPFGSTRCSSSPAAGESTCQMSGKGDKNNCHAPRQLGHAAPRCSTDGRARELSTSPGDSSFAIMLSAQPRGHKLYHYLADRRRPTKKAGFMPGRTKSAWSGVLVVDHFRLGDFNILSPPVAWY